MIDPPDLGPDGPAALRRPTAQATHRGKVVARTVAADALETVHALGFITDDQFNAGKRLRNAYAGSWWSPHVQPRHGWIASESSFLDESEAEADIDERRNAAFAIWQSARAILGALWEPTICLCGFSGRPNQRQAFLGLQTLAKAWGDE